MKNATKFWLSEEELMKLIKLEGVENIRFNIPMRPVHQVPMMGIAFSTSSDKEVVVPCKINTDRYNPLEGYKITMESMIDGFGCKHFYVSDFVSLIRKGKFEIRGYRWSNDF